MLYILILVANGIVELTRFKIARPAEIFFEVAFMCGRQLRDTSM